MENISNKCLLNFSFKIAAKNYFDRILLNKIKTFILLCK